MRRAVLSFVGALYVLMALIGFALPSSGFFSADKSYNVFLGILGLLALSCADMGGLEGKWFDFIFGLVLIVMTIVGAVNYLNFGTGSLGNIFVNGLASIFLLYLGIVVNHRLKHQEK